MKLRSQLVLVSLLVLLLPWAGCSYVREMENALRQGQQDALVSVTRSVVSLVSARRDLLDELTAGEKIATSGTDIYLHDIVQGLSVDGYVDDGLDFAADAVTFADDQPLRLSVWAASDGEQAYVYARVNDASISYRNPVTGELRGSDFLQLTLDDEEGYLRSYWISPEAPGEFTALRARDGKFVSEFRIRGAWRDTEEGYDVELTLPRKWLHQRFGIVAVDGADPTRWIGSMGPGTEPGRLIGTSRPLMNQLGVIAQDNLRVSVVDARQRLLAVRGNLGLAPDSAAQAAPGVWLIEALYRLAAPGPSGGADYTAPDKGRLLRDEVTRAVAGESNAIWYPTDAENNLAIVSAAMPIRYQDRVVGAVVTEQTSAGILSLTNAALVRLAGISTLLVFLIVAGLVGYASWLSLRIHRLSRQVSVVMEPGGRELRAFPAQTAADEIGTLGRSFARLLGSMRAYTDYLQTLASKLSHELRTPLAVVRSSLENLEHEQVSPEAAQYLRRARDGSERLGHILNAMSEASRVEHSIGSAETGPVNVSRVLVDVVAGYRSVYPQRSIECDTADSEITIIGNAELLAQMLDKLMDNARDFCPADGVIRFSLARQGFEAVIAVENDGPPLPPAMADQLFESMVSVRDGKDEHVHMGLGLTIVRLVAKFHGGSAAAANRADGSGVVFSIRIPCNE